MQTDDIIYFYEFSIRKDKFLSTSVPVRGLRTVVLMKKTVIFSYLGSKRDAGDANAELRWEKWRPNVAIAKYCDPETKSTVDRIELFYNPDDEELLKQIEADIKEVSPNVFVKTNEMKFNDPWDFEEVYVKFLDFMLSYKFDTEKEEYLLHVKTGTHVAQICYFLLTEALYFPGKLLQSFNPKNENRPKGKEFAIVDLNRTQYSQITTRFDKRKKTTTFLKSEIKTRNKVFNELIEQIDRVAIRTKEPILFTGGTGVGKSLLASRIFELKKQQHNKKPQHKLDGGFVAINAATLRGDNAMSALFGHIKGAFTGAESNREGLLKKADKGLLFLDEIGELGLDVQGMLLKAIEEKRFPPFGSDKEVQSDFQLIAATNRDLVAAVKAGTFREDLLARINLWTFRIPNLAERPEDIEPNIDFELKKLAENDHKITFDKTARERFVAFAKSPQATWRANFRDLNAAIRRMATLAPSDCIDDNTVKKEIERLTSIWQEYETGPVEKFLLRELLDEEVLSQLDLFDEFQLTRVIEVCCQSKSLADAGRKLYQHSRTQKTSTNDTTRLSKYLAGFGLTWETIHSK